MKLVRNAVTAANPDLRGTRAHFTIENASAAALEAVDKLLSGNWASDQCPLYDEGVSCGYWIELSDIEEFKADYKAAKSNPGKAPAVEANPPAADTEAAKPFEYSQRLVTLERNLHREYLAEASEHPSGQVVKVTKLDWRDAGTPRAG